MGESMKDDATDGSRFVGRIGVRRSRSGNRLWPTERKGRIVRESLAPGARVADVAREYGLCARQLTEWRRAARSGRLALVADEPAEFVEIELNEAATRSEADVKIEIVIGKVAPRLERVVFRSKRMDRLKILPWDGTGLVPVDGQNWKRVGERIMAAPAAAN
jgi:transposase